VVLNVGVDVDDGTGRGDEVDVTEGVGRGVGVVDGVDVEVGSDRGGVGVRVWSVDGQPPGGAGTKSSGLLMCWAAAGDWGDENVSST